MHYCSLGLYKAKPAYYGTARYEIISVWGRFLIIHVLKIWRACLLRFLHKHCQLYHRLHNFISISEISNHSLQAINLVTNHNVPLPQSQMLVCFWLSHLQITLTRSLRCIQFLLSVVPLSFDHYNFILVIKPTRNTNFSNLFLKYDSTCFGQYLCPSSGVWHCTHSNRHRSYKLCWLLASE